MASPQISDKAAQALNLPQGWKSYSPFPFGGMNVQAASHAVPDNEFPYIENFIRLGDGNLRTLWDKGAAIYTAPAGKTIVYFKFFTLAVDFFCAVFLSDGSAIQISMADLTTKAISGVGPKVFYLASSGYRPFACQWGSTWLLICNRNSPNDYWVWDGNLLYYAGTAAPQGVNILSGGANYSAVPTMTVYGGLGVGMTVSGRINAGAVATIDIDNPGTGYLPGDVVQIDFMGGNGENSAVLGAGLPAGGVGAVTVVDGGSGYTSAPAVTFSGGGGAGATATATVTNGVITDVQVTGSGAGYITAPVVVFTGGGGAGGVGQALLGASGVAGIAVADGGSGFTSVPLLTIQGGGGAGATAVAILAPTTIARINVTAGGSGYTSAPVVVFHGGEGDGGFIIPTATANLVGESVGSITITTAGTAITTSMSITFTGGGGSGAGAEIVFTPTSIASVQVLSAGKYYTTAPAVLVTPGANQVVAATITLMPYGISGSAMETFLSRVWIVDPAPQPFNETPPGNLWNYSSPGSVVDFSGVGGGGDATNTDSFLQTRYTNVRQSGGYLYFFGDGSVSVLSNVNTAGTPVITTYNYQNVDPQFGLSWRDAIQDSGRSILVANENGVFGLYGGSLANVSLKIQQLFNRAVYPIDGGIEPTSATATIFNIKHYVEMLTINDPDTGVHRTVMLLWNEKEWMLASQLGNVDYIGTQKVQSEYRAWGTDGLSLYPLFTTPSGDLPKGLDTKIYGADRMFLQKQADTIYMQAQDQTADSGVNGALALSVSGLAIQNEFDPSLPSGVFSVALNPPVFQCPYPHWGLWGTTLEGCGFIMAGLRFRTSSPDFILGNLLIGYVETAANR